MNDFPLLRRILRRATGASARRLGPRSRLGRTAVIDNLLRDPERIRIGADCVVQGQLLVFRHGGRIRIGEWCFIGENSRLWSGSAINIGDRVLISHDVNIFDNDTHPIDAEARHRQFVAIKTQGHPSDVELADQPVTIESDVWIGAKATILKGVTIGRGAVVAAGSVVTRDVPQYVIVAGNPARVVRRIAGDDSLASTATLATSSHQTS